MGKKVIKNFIEGFSIFLMIGFNVGIFNKYIFINGNINLNNKIDWFESIFILLENDLSKGENVMEWVGELERYNIIYLIFIEYNNFIYFDCCSVIIFSLFFFWCCFNNINWCWLLKFESIFL